MTNKIKTLLLLLIACPLLSVAQHNHEGRSDPERDGKSFTVGIIENVKEYENTIEYGGSGDEGEESEDVILEITGFADFRTNVIHYLNRFDYTKLNGSIPIQLEDKEHGKRFSCPVEMPVTSKFGPRRRRFHYGVDLGARTGTPVKSMLDGQVRYAGWCSGYGNIVVVRHENGLETYYGHLSKINVKANDIVKSGHIIGNVGNTGRSFGSHLHLEIRYLGAAMNPEHFIDFSTYQPKVDEKGMYNITRADFKPSFSKGSTNTQVAKNSKKSTKGNRSSSAVASHKVKQGETLSSIARKHGTTVAKLQKLNGMKGSTKLRAGQTIRVK